jgi:hypothetical protein
MSGQDRFHFIRQLAQQANVGRGDAAAVQRCHLETFTCNSFMPTMHFLTINDNPQKKSKKNNLQFIHANV